MRLFSVVWFTGYLFGMTGFLWMGALFVTYVPSARATVELIRGILLGCAVLFGVLTYFLGQFPPTHWSHQPRPFTIGLATLAITLLVMLTVVV